MGPQLLGAVFITITSSTIRLVGERLSLDFSYFSFRFIIHGSKKSAPFLYNFSRRGEISFAFLRKNRG